MAPTGDEGPFSSEDVHRGNPSSLDIDPIFGINHHCAAKTITIPVGQFAPPFHPFVSLASAAHANGLAFLRSRRLFRFSLGSFFGLFSQRRFVFGIRGGPFGNVRKSQPSNSHCE